MSIDYADDEINNLNESSLSEDAPKGAILVKSEYGVDLKAFEIFKQKIGYYDKVIDDE